MFYKAKQLKISNSFKRIYTPQFLFEIWESIESIKSLFNFLWNKRSYQILTFSSPFTSFFSFALQTNAKSFQAKHLVITKEAHYASHQFSKIVIAATFRIIKNQLLSFSSNQMSNVKYQVSEFFQTLFLFSFISSIDMYIFCVLAGTQQIFYNKSSIFLFYFMQRNSKRCFYIVTFLYLFSGQNFFQEHNFF